MKGFLLAVQFLTIIPVRIKGTISEAQVGRSSLFFPLVGLIQGVIVGLGAYLLSIIFPQNLVAGLVVLLLIASNGGFHMDGLADTFDATAVKSSGDLLKDRERRLAVMKDSATGAIGVTAVVMAVLLKYLLVAALLGKYDVIMAAELLLLMAVLSKWTMVPVMAHGQPARKEGLGRIFVERTGVKEALVATLLMAAVFSGTILLARPVSVRPFVGFFTLCAGCLYLFGAGWAWFCRMRFGGLTGDTAGAAGELADIVYLVVAYVWFS
jgi:adenosylcobinamide-GDP ribazoletransferase